MSISLLEDTLRFATILREEKTGHEFMAVGFRYLQAKRIGMVLLNAECPCGVNGAFEIIANSQTTEFKSRCFENTKPIFDERKTTS